MTDTLDEVRRKIDGAVLVDPEHGLYRGRREAFTDPELFELEMKYIFEGNWIYLAHESQIPEQQRLPDHLHRPAADRDLPGQGG